MRCVIVACVLASFGAGCARLEQASASKAPTKEDVEKVVLGKTPEQVIEAMGRPDKTYDYPKNEWMYRNRAVHPVTGAVDTVLVEFKSGKASHVRFIGSSS